MKLAEIRRHRMQNQRLVGAPFDTPQDMVWWHGAVQAQDYAGAKWGVAQRTHDVTDTDLDALFNDGAILRTHMMRPTWHLVMPADIRWIQALTAHRVHAMNASMARKLELDAAVFAMSNTVITDTLQGGNHLTRKELGEALERNGIEASGQRLAYLVMHAELKALICSGPRRGKQFTYALLDERVPPTRPLHRDEALVELTRRYFTSHGPATPHDLSWWSGLTVTDARAGVALLEDELLCEKIGDTTWWFPRDASSTPIEPPIVHLLPNFDEYFIGFKNHEPTYEPSVRARFDYTGDNWMANMIAVNGSIVGAWRRKITRDRVSIATTLMTGLDDAERAALMCAADDFGRFLKLPVTVQ